MGMDAKSRAMRVGLTLGVGFVGMGMGWAGGAGPAAAQATRPAATQESEIVVTARKREETLLSIPVSGSVVTEQEILDIGGFTDEQDFGAFLPGVTVDSVGNAEFFIRGAGTGVTPFTSSVVTQFRNGAEVAGGFGGRTYERMDFFDVRQSEVYRGAQGALYGRNAVGGVINLISNDPKPYREYRIQTSYGFTEEETRVDLVYNQPLIADRVFLRLGAAFEDGNGFYENAFYGDEPVNAPEFWGARVGLKALISEKLDATFIIDRGEFAFDSLLADFSTTSPGATFNVFDDPVGLDGQPIPPDTTANDVTPANPLAVGFPANNPGDVFRQAFDTRGYADENTLTANLRVNYELPFAVAQWISGYRQRDYDLNFDVDRTYLGGVLAAAPGTCSPFIGTTATRVAGPLFITGAGLATLDTNAGGQFILTGTRPVTAEDLNGVGTAGQCENFTDSRTYIFTQELRLVSSSEGRFNWLLGLDYRRFDNPVAQRNIGRNPPATSALTATQGLVNLTAANLAFNTETLQQSYGAYGSFGYDLTDWLTIAGSLRYAVEDVAFTNLTTDLDPVRGFVARQGAAGIPTTRGNVAAPGVGSLLVNRDFGDVIQSIDESETFERILPSIYLTGDWNDWLVYASWGESFRAGGFNRIGGAGTFQGAPIVIPAQYDEETSDSYELGAKRRFQYGRSSFDFAATLFLTEYANIIQTTTVTALTEDEGEDLNQDQFSDLVAFNLGDAYVRGLEIDFRSRLANFLWSGGPLSFNGGITYSESEVQSGPRDGFELTFVNTWTYNGNITYRRAVPGFEQRLGLFLNTNFSTQIDTDNAGNASGRGPDTRRTVNARGGFEGELGERNWQLSVFADNVLDVQYETSRPFFFGSTPGVRYNNPISVGVRLAISGR